MAFPTADAVADVVGPAVAAHGLELEDVTVHGAGASTRVVVLVDGDDAPDLDRVALASEDVSRALDEAEASGMLDFGSGYELEVSTPGVGHPLTEPRHWRRNRGRLVRVVLGDGSAEYGRIGALDEAREHVAFIVGPAAKAAAGRVKKGARVSQKAVVRALPLSSVATAVVEVEFTLAPEVEMALAESDFDAAVHRLED
ncbi:ribosome maturation factor RimP [Corynebacterium sp.]|uniref:ribosome maturation factor RimP n=1 Tax=Corynebacterium sp. TaxID=1720 RepID=UPI0026DC1693|nr:ribosome maturation factor RimP [Corynebacterium sp.]MDO4610877.1 ribosome maturation factor RimP [Corynebacterium sp.]